MMRKDKKIETESVKHPDIDSNQVETDQVIFEQINKRNEENQALKKLLDNLNSSFPKQEAK